MHNILLNNLEIQLNAGNVERIAHVLEKRLGSYKSSEGTNRGMQHEGG